MRRRCILRARAVHGLSLHARAAADTADWLRFRCLGAGWRGEASRGDPFGHSNKCSHFATVVRVSARVARKHGPDKSQSPPASTRGDYPTVLLPGHCL